MYRPITNLLYCCAFAISHLLYPADAFAEAPQDCGGWYLRDSGNDPSRPHPFFARASANTIQKCLKSGADPNSAPSGYSPLHHVSKHGNSAAALALLEGGADPNLAASNGIRPLHLIGHSLEMLRILLHAGANPSARDQLGQTPLFFAANEAVVNELIKAGADPNAKSKYEYTALRSARKTDVLLALLRHGADPNPRESPWSERRTGEAVLALIKAGTKIPSDVSYRSPLYDAVLDERGVRALASAGASVNAVWNGATPLMSAVRAPNLSLDARHAIVAALGDLGADPNVADRFGRTALDTASDIRLIRALRKLGARVRIECSEWRSMNQRQLSQNDGGTFLNKLARVTAEDVKHCVQAGIDPNASLKTEFGSTTTTPLHTVLDEEAAAALINLGANPSARDKAGRTPFHIGNHILLLIAAGAEVNARDDSGQTPLHYAAERASPEDVQALLAAGADANALDVNGDAAIHLIHGATTRARRLATAELLASAMEMPLDCAPWFVSGWFGSAWDDFSMMTEKSMPNNPDRCLDSWSRVLGNGAAPPLILAASRNIDPDVIRKMVKAGADPNQLLTLKGFNDEQEQVTDFPLYTAAYFNNSIALRTLLELGADPNISVHSDFSKGGYVPLHLVTAMDNAVAVAALLEKGADPNVRGVLGEGALGIARRVSASASVVEMLIAAGAE